MSKDAIQIGTNLRIGKVVGTVMEINVCRRHDTGEWDTILHLQVSIADAGATITQVPIDELAASIDEGEIEILPYETDEPNDV